jgi:hypothetical protein
MAAGCIDIAIYRLIDIYAREWEFKTSEESAAFNGMSIC